MQRFFLAIIVIGLLVLVAATGVLAIKSELMPHARSAASDLFVDHGASSIF
jgi:hypothetical protein